MVLPFVGIALLFVGLFGIYYGQKRYRVYRLVTETPTTSAGSITEEGLVELTGEVTADETVAAPATAANVVLAAWLAKEYDTSGKGANWKTIAAGIESVPFTLDDGTGEVVVDLGTHAEGSNTVARLSDMVASEGVGMNDVVCEFENFTRAAEVGVDDPPPTHIQEFVARSPAIGRAEGAMLDLDILDVGNKHGDRRYWEGVVRPGDEVYLLGHARRRDTEEFGDPKWTIEPPNDDEDGLAIVSTVKSDRLAARARLGTVALPAGVFLAGLGAVMVLMPTALPF